MKQEQFEKHYAEQWQEFEQWLISQKSKKHQRNLVNEVFAINELPKRYRSLCRLLALARDRGFSLSLIEHLHNLVQQGHDILYRRASGLFQQTLSYISSGFARDVYINRRYFFTSAAMFFGSMFLMMLIIRLYPDFIYTIISRQEVLKIREMYSDQSIRLGEINNSSSRFMMFGFYVYHNTSLGFQCFAGGLFAGLGSVVTVLFNGITLGAIEADLANNGIAHNLYSFIAAHSPFELGAVILAGGAGLKLGMAILAPQRRKRIDALREAGRSMIGIVSCSALMFFIAALLESFWSPLQLVLPIKLFVGAVILSILLSYFIVIGRKHAA